MPVPFLGRQILSPEEFIANRDAGGFNLHLTYEDYLQMIRSQVALAAQARAEAAELGFELKGPELDLSPEMEKILDQVWTEVAAKKEADEETQIATRSA